MDKIEIRVTRGCDAEGNGGTVVENAGALLGDVVGNGPMLDAILGAFADAYGVYTVDEVPVNLYRNLTYRIRTHITEITAAFLRKQAIEQFTAQVDSQVDVTLGSVTIIDQSSF